MKATEDVVNSLDTVRGEGWASVQRGQESPTTAQTVIKTLRETREATATTHQTLWKLRQRIKEVPETEEALTRGLAENTSGNENRRFRSDGLHKILE